MIWSDSKPDMSQRASAVMSSMTLAEKVFFQPSRQSDTTRDCVQRSFVIASRAIRRGFSAGVSPNDEKGGNPFIWATEIGFKTAIELFG
jgi:hypothetical protein